ncbi:hypothetical protein QL093DRAFT_2101737 [Fusarium oxysporum]|nr:hypothetical protein QL093DRAFT_2101737 [Fusarium oxysporum]
MPVIEIPKEQWAQVLEKPGGRVCLLVYLKLVVVHKKVPVHMPGPDEVLVNVKYSGIFHTDLHAMMGDWPLKRKVPLP